MEILATVQWNLDEDGLHIVKNNKYRQYRSINIGINHKYSTSVFMMINHHSFDNTPLFEVLNTPGDHSVPSGLNLAKKILLKVTTWVLAWKAHAETHIHSTTRKRNKSSSMQKHIDIELQERGTNPPLCTIIMFRKSTLLRSLPPLQT